MTAALAALLEAIIYPMARGAVRAWFDVQAERQNAIEETRDAPTDTARIADANAAIQQLRGAPAGHPGPQPATPPGTGH